MNKFLTNKVAILITCLYLLVHFINDFGGADVMGAQWLYVGLLNLGVLFYIFLKKKDYNSAIQAVYQYKFTLVYSLLVCWAMGSYFYAINPTETLVTLVRLINTYFIFIHLSILYYQQDMKQLFNGIALFTALILTYDAIFVLNGLLKNMESMNLDQNIISLMGNHGNKNVMAATLLIKFPFCLWLLFKNKGFIRFLGMGILMVGVMGLLVLNTRSTYVGLAIIIILFIATTVYFKKENSKKAITTQIAYFIIPIFLGIFFANLILENAVKLQDVQTGYGTVAKRIGDITLASEQNSRIHLWGTAIDYTLKHPFIGAGYGNWKLASIPYEKAFANELFVPYHAHNDFLEMFADLGIIGGLSFGLMFILGLLFTLQTWRNKEAKDFHFMATISFLALTCYAVDAILNFPAERPAMQTLLALSAALIFAPSVFIKKVIISNHLLPVKKKQFKFITLLYLIFALVLIVPSIYIANETFKSLKIQKFVMGEVNQDPLMLTEEVVKMPIIPNLSSSTLPLKAMIARYYIRDKNFGEALRLLRESENDNPYLHYNDFLRTAIFAAVFNYDSALYYSKKAFYNWPRASSYYKNIIFAAAKKKDTLALKDAYDTSKKYSNNALTWNQYLLGMFEVKGGGDARMIQMVDSAILLFPKDSAILVPTRNMLFGKSTMGATVNTFLNKGIQFFQNGAYIQAAKEYSKASEIEPTNYTHYENAAICFYSAGQYDNSLPYFDKAMQFSSNTTGKSAFFKAMALIAKGNKPAACIALKMAQVKGYPGVEPFITQNCK